MQRLHTSHPLLYHPEAHRTHERLIFIITASPVLAAAVGDYFRDLDGELSVVWMTSADHALNRLGLENAAWVILDDLGPSTEAHVASLGAAAPDAKIMLLAGGRLPGAAVDPPVSTAPRESTLPTRSGARWEPSSPLRFQRSTEDQALAGHLQGLG
jgi:hypothetical protein